MVKKYVVKNPTVFYIFNPSHLIGDPCIKYGTIKYEDKKYWRKNDIGQKKMDIEELKFNWTATYIFMTNII